MQNYGKGIIYNTHYLIINLQVPKEGKNFGAFQVQMLRKSSNHKFFINET